MQDTLAKRIKAKYPDYNDIPDEELEDMITKKYPGDYDDIPRTKKLTTETPPVATEGALSRYGSAAWEGVKGLGHFAKNIAVGAAGPLGDVLFPETKDTAVKEIGEGVIDPFKELGKEGDPRVKFGRFATKMIGADPDTLDKKYAEGDYAGIAGHLTVPAVLAGSPLAFRKGKPAPVLDPIPSPPKLLGEGRRGYAVSPDGNAFPLRDIPEMMPPRGAITPDGTVSPFDQFGRTDVANLPDRPVRDFGTNRTAAELMLDEKTGPKSTHLGIASESIDPNLPYPLNIVPNRLRPRNVQNELVRQTPEALQAIPEPVNVGKTVNIADEASGIYDAAIRNGLTPEQANALAKESLGGTPKVKPLGDKVPRSRSLFEQPSAAPETRAAKIARQPKNEPTRSIIERELGKDAKPRDAIRNIDAEVAAKGGAEPLPSSTLGRMRASNENLGGGLVPKDAPEGAYFDRSVNKLMGADGKEIPLTRSQRATIDKKLAREVELKEAGRVGEVIDRIPDENLKLGLRDEAKNIASLFKKSNTKRVYDDLFTSGSRILENMGESGKQISKLLRDTETAASAKGGKWAAQLKDLTRALSKDEQTQVAKILDGQEKITPETSASVKTAASSLRKILDDVAGEASAVGMHMKNTKTGQRFPFQKMEGDYFPRRYEKGVLDEILKDKDTLKQKLQKEGLSPEEVDRTVKNMVNYGERYTDSQYGRLVTKELPHRLDMNVLEEYFYEMGRRIEESRKLGPLDTAQKSGPLSDLINSLDDTNRDKAMDVIKDYLGRDEIAPEYQRVVAENIAKFEVITKLTRFIVNNMVELAPAFRESGTVPILKAIGRTLFDTKKASKAARDAGAFEIFHRNLLLDQTFGNKYTKLYGMESAEKFVRTVSANAGKAIIESKFKQLQKAKGKKATRLKNELSHFLEESPDYYLKNGLSKEAIDFGAGRFVELTSGKPNALSLPPLFFAKNPLARLPLMFKRFAFIASKNMKDSFAQPGRYSHAKVARTLSGYLIMGELVGDVLAGVKGALDPNKSIIEAIKDRGDLQDRLIANAMQSWLFGLVGDTINAAKSGAVPLFKHIGGPVISDVVDTGVNISSLLKDKTEGGKPRSFEDRINPTRNWASRNIPVPIIGPELGSKLRREEKKTPRPFNLNFSVK